MYSSIAWKRLRLPVPKSVRSYPSHFPISSLKRVVDSPSKIHDPGGVRVSNSWKMACRLCVCISVERVITRIEEGAVSKPLCHLLSKAASRSLEPRFRARSSRNSPGCTPSLCSTQWHVVHALTPSPPASKENVTARWLSNVCARAFIPARKVLALSGGTAVEILDWIGVVEPAFSR